MRGCRIYDSPAVLRGEAMKDRKLWILPVLCLLLAGYGLTACYKTWDSGIPFVTEQDTVPAEETDAATSPFGSEAPDPVVTSKPTEITTPAVTAPALTEPVVTSPETIPESIPETEPETAVETVPETETEISAPVTQASETTMPETTPVTTSAPETTPPETVPKETIRIDENGDIVLPEVP